MVLDLVSSPLRLLGNRVGSPTELVGEMLMSDQHKRGRRRRRIM